MCKFSDTFLSSRQLKELKILYHSDSSKDHRLYQGKCCLFKDPFRVVQVDGFLQCPNNIVTLRQSVKDLSTIEKNNDLYCLHQSRDLNDIRNFTVSGFIRHLKKTVAPQLEELVGYSLRHRISITASVYKKGDYLLCHDDKLDDRAIAFVYYLNSDSLRSGSFDMFDHDYLKRPGKVVKSIFPKENRFIFFEVGDLTYHQVAELLEDNDRLSINGWFHSSRRHVHASHAVDAFPKLTSALKLEGVVFIDDFINSSYILPIFLSEVKDNFSENSSLALPYFFRSSLYKECYESLHSSRIVWKNKGPANQRNYEIADLSDLPHPASLIINFLRSTLFISFLRNFSQLYLLSTGKGKYQMAEVNLVMEVRRYTAGSYTMATENNEFFKKTGLDLFFFFCDNEISNSTGGYITYIAAGNDTLSSGSDNDGELLTIFPQNNYLFAVYRTSDTYQFFKYLNHLYQGAIYCIAATYYEQGVL